LANLSTGKTANEVINYILQDPRSHVKLAAWSSKLAACSLESF